MSNPASETILKLVDNDGNTAGRLRIWSTRKSEHTGLRDSSLSSGGALDWLTESSIYGYELTLSSPASLNTLEPNELFDPDWTGALRGRLRTGNRAGMMIIGLSTSNGIYATGKIEIKSSKLDYDNEFQWMLRDITSDFVEVALARFGATQLQYTEPKTGDSSSTLYHKFAFLRAMLESEDFTEAIQQIIANPYIAWRDCMRSSPSSRGLRSSHASIRAMSSAGPRRPMSMPIGLLSAIPRHIAEHAIEPEIDNLPNQYIKSLIEDWRCIAQSVHDALRKELTSNRFSSPVLRGLAETERAIDELDAILARPLFKKISRLVKEPAANQILLKKEGYREILRLHRQTYLTAELEWDGAEQVFGAGLRDVATLYEYWVFLQLGQIIAKICGSTFDFSSLFALSSNGLQLNLSKKRAQVIKGQVDAADQQLQIELWFNRPFQKGNGEAWTRNMRPDFSLAIGKASDINMEKRIWLHFDAKYRVDHLFEIFGNEDEIISESSEVTGGRALRNDLLKMHAYRDAIHRSSGAYVIYPGHGTSGQDEIFLKYHELLPGLGAFSLRPAQDGGAVGTNALSSFIQDVILHAGNVLSRDCRLRFWTDQIMAESSSNVEPVAYNLTEGIGFLDRPPHDETLILLRTSEYIFWDAPRERLIAYLSNSLPSRFFSAKWILLLHDDSDEPTLLSVDENQNISLQNNTGSRNSVFIELISSKMQPPKWLLRPTLELLLKGQDYFIGSWGNMIEEIDKHI